MTAYILAYALIAILIAFLIVASLLPFKYLIDDIKHKKQKEAEAELKMLEDRKRKKIEKTAISIYNKCKEKNILSFNTARETNALKLIAGIYGVSDLEEAKEYFAKGKQLITQQNEEKEREEFIQGREYDKERFEKAKATAFINGKKKYTGKIDKERPVIDIYDALADSAIHRAESNLTYTAPKSDWAFWGGVANGLAGGAAGAATAYDIQLKNAEAEANAAHIRENAKEELSDAIAIKTKINSTKDSYDAAIDSINNKLIDNTNISEKFAMLNFTNTSITVNDYNNIEVTVKCKIKTDEPIELLGSKAVLDGSLKIEVRDSSRRLVGIGYYSAPGLGKTDLSCAGFNNVKEISALCFVEDYETIDKKDHFTCKISPVNMWIIEC